MVGKKIVMVGSPGAGKTVLHRRLLGLGFQSRYEATLGCEIHPVLTAAGRLNVWDVAGQERFSGLREGYYIEADAAVVVYDASSRLSIRQVQEWHEDVMRTAGDIPVLFLGNKVDIARRAPGVPKAAEGSAHTPLRLECSAKTAAGVRGAFETLAAQVC